MVKIQYSLENLRSLTGSSWIEMKPINILVGSNSSGKSTFARSLPLVRQSMETRTSSLILWYSDVDFGSFQSSKSQFSNEDYICFGFGATVKKEKFSSYRRSLGNTFIRVLSLTDIDLKIKYFIESSAEGSDLLKSIQIISKNHGTIQLDQDMTSQNFCVTSFDGQLINNFPLRIETLLDSLFAPMWCSTPGRQGEFNSELAILDILTEQLAPLAHGNLTNKRQREILRNLLHMDGLTEDNLQQLVKPSAAKFLKDSAAYIGDCLKGSPISIAELTLRIFYILQEYYNVAPRLTAIFSDTQYIGPSRATAERYYRVQNLAIDRIDKSGENISTYLNSLDAEHQDILAAWFSQLFDRSVQIKRDRDHIEIVLKEEYGDINIADAGYGISQVLPIISSLLQRRISAKKYENKFLPTILVLEQPELHLHPKQQAKLAEIFIQALIDPNKGYLDASCLTSLVIETHSEHIINQLGHLIGSNIVDPSAVSVHLFERINGKCSITTTTFDRQGYLRNWPSDFFVS